MTYQKMKARFNYYVDRVIDWGDWIATQSYGIKNPILSQKIRLIAQSVGDYGRILTEFPRLNTYKIEDSNCSIYYVGGDDTIKTRLSNLLFPNGYTETYIGRTASWQLSAQVSNWLNKADMVVCKASRKSPWAPRDEITFDNPIMVKQVLKLDKPLDMLLAGSEKAKQDLRRSIRRMQQANFTYRFSRSLSDFDHFYYEMYLPMVKSRFGAAADIRPYEGLLNHWMKPGGLLLLSLDNKPVGGCLTYIQNKSCFIGDAGILDCDVSLIKQGINTALFWHNIQWALSQGASIINMGGTDAWQSSGVFYAKQRWGARVVEYPLQHNQLIFLIDEFQHKWLHNINKSGFLTCMKGKYLRVYLNDPKQPFTSVEVDARIKKALRSGLDGVQIVSKSAKTNYLKRI